MKVGKIGGCLFWHNKTHVEELTATSRKEELARMLAGSEITDEARAAAGKLMAVKNG